VNNEEESLEDSFSILIEVIGAGMKDRIEELHQAYSSEVMITCQAFVAMKNLKSIPFHDRDTHRRMNKNARTWNIITHSLQVTTFIALGRIFDESSDSHSVHSLLNYCMRNKREFSRGWLYRRKIRDGLNEELARDYVRDKHAPCMVFFKRLNKVKSEYTKIYKTLYRDIRHKVFAHKIALSLEESQNLFSRTSVAEIEDTLCFLYQLDKVIWQLITNGNITDLCNHGCLERVLIEENVSKLLKSLT
jgi:hypothetical protein